MTNALTANDFFPATCQASIFTPDHEIAAAWLVRELLPKWVDRFDADPLILPALEGLPRRPRLVLRSKSDEWRCDIAAARVNVVWRNTGEGRPSVTLDECLNQATALLEQYVQLTTARVGRLAGVLNWFAKHDSPGLFLARHFCKDRWESAPLNRPEGFELHSLKHYSLMGRYAVNSWVRNKTATFSTSGSQYPIVLVEQDLNTLAEETPDRNFTTRDIQEYFGLLSKEFPSILHLYYPMNAQ